MSREGRVTTGSTMRDVLMTASRRCGMPEDPDGDHSKMTATFVRMPAHADLPYR